MMDEDLEQQPFASPLAQLQGVITDPTAQSAIGEAVTHINNHLEQAAIADANTAAGENLSNDWQRFGGGLVQWVQRDPTAVHAALDAVSPVARGFINSIPNVQGDPDAHHDALVGDLQKQIAISAVKSTAEQHAGLTADLLGNDRISGLLGSDTRKQLIQYGSFMADARDRDAQSQAIEASRRQYEASQGSVLAHANDLIDSNTAGPAFPDGWHQRVMADQNVPYPQKGALGDLYYTLRTRGDTPDTDGLTAASLVRQIASGSAPPVEDFLGHVTNGNLRLQDAMSLAYLAQDKGDQGKDHANGLAQLVDAGRTAIMGRDGENGAAGVSAFGRYMNWLLPNYRRTGSVGAIPEADGYLLRNGLGTFMPTGDDVVPARTTEERRPLKEIFGG